MSSCEPQQFPMARLSAPWCCFCLMVTLPAAFAGTNSMPAQGGFAAFHVISERNIFDTARSPRGPQRETVVERKTTERFRLVGTMSYERGVVAFCDSEQADLKRAVHAGDTLGGLRVESVAHDHIRLRAGEQEIQLPIQRQLQRDGDGTWRLLEPEPSLPDFPPATTSLKPAVMFAERGAAPGGLSEKQQRKLEASGSSDKQIRKLEKEIEEMFKPTKEVKEYAREMKALQQGSPAIKISKKPDKALRRGQ